MSWKGCGLQDSAEVGSDHGGQVWDWDRGHEEVSSCGSKMSFKIPRTRVHPIKSCHDLAGYYGFKDLKKNEFKSPIKGFGNNSENKIWHEVYFWKWVLDRVHLSKMNRDYWSKVHTLL